MQRWNGWGDESVNMAVAPAGLEMLANRIGRGRQVPDCPLEKY